MSFLGLKASGIAIFSDGIEREHWPEMSHYNSALAKIVEQKISDNFVARIPRWDRRLIRGIFTSSVFFLMKTKSSRKKDIKWIFSKTQNVWSTTKSFR